MPIFRLCYVLFMLVFLTCIMPTRAFATLSILEFNIATNSVTNSATNTATVERKSDSTKADSTNAIVQRMPDKTAARYRGIFDVRVIEPNTAQYILGVKFTAGYNKPFDFLLRPYNGKASIETFLPIYVNNNGEDKRSFKINHKYYVSLRIREDSDSHFSAHISLFKRQLDSTLDINKPYRYHPSDFTEVSSGNLKGELNKVNEYLFVDREDLKFYFKLNFDILFTEQEIIRRFHNKTQ